MDAVLRARQARPASSRRARRPTGAARRITFLPDLEIFETIDYDRAVLEQRFREMAFLTRGLRIDFSDERGEGFETSFQYDGGIVDFVKYLHSQGTREPLHPKVVYIEDSGDVGEVEVALQWNNSYQESLLSFANNINTHEGGTHLSGFRSALTRTINAYARQKGELKEKDANLQGEDVREGLTAIISVKIHDPQFEGQTKTKLGNPPVEGFVQAAVNRGLAEFLEENPREARPDHPQGGRRPPAPARPPARRATSRGASRRSRTPRCPASSPTARSATRRSPRSSSSRATRPAARPSRAATATRRRSCRCAARSSTSRRTGSTRCSPTRRSRR